MIHDRSERFALIGLVGFGGVSALAGSYGLLAGSLGMEQGVLDGSPFTSFTIPALILGSVVGGSQLVALVGLLRHRGWSVIGAGAAGCIMTGWIVGEILLLGSDPGMMRNLQGIYLLLGLLEAALAALLLRRTQELSPTA